MELTPTSYYDYLGDRKNPPLYTIDDAVVKTLEPTGDGHIERAAEHAQSCADMLGALVQHLHEKRLLDDDEVLKLLPSFQRYTGAPSDTR